MAIHLTRLLKFSKNYGNKYPYYLVNHLISKRNVQEFPGLKLNNELPKDHLIILPETLNEKPELNELLRLPKIGEREVNFSKLNCESVYKGLSQTILLFENYITDVNDEITTISDKGSLEEIFKDLEKHLYPMDSASNILNVLINVRRNDYHYKEVYDLLTRYYAVRELRFGPVFKDCFQKYSKEKLETLSLADKKLLNIYYPRNPKREILSSIDESTLTHYKKHLKDDINRFRANVHSANQLFSHTVDDPDILANVSSRFYQSQDLHHKERTPLKINIDNYRKFMNVCPDRFVRQNLWQVCNKRCSPKAYTKFNNISIINNIRVMRKKIADLSGYRSHVEFRLENAMANSKQEIIHNLESLNETNSKILTERLQELNDYAADNSSEDYGQSGLQEYDIDYWSHKYVYEILIGKSEDALREFFPLNKVLFGIQEYFSDYFGIELKENHDKKEQLWAKNIAAYDVYRNNQPIGTLLHDAYRRDNKNLYPFYARLRGRNNDIGCLPLRLLSTSYSMNNKKEQAQLSVLDVVDLFYAYGSLLQRLLYNYKYYELNIYGGLQVDVNNFIPNLCVACLLTDHRILQSCSDRGGSKPIDTETSQRIIKALTYFNCFKTWRSLYKAHLDLEAHSVFGDIRYLAQEAYSRYSPFERDPDNFDYCTLNEIFVGPNDGVQYSDIWSKQLATYYLNAKNDNKATEQLDTLAIKQDRELNVKLLDELFDSERLNIDEKLLSLVGRSFEPSKTDLGVL